MTDAVIDTATVIPDRRAERLIRNLEMAYVVRN
jgi:hypothetical protein